jgi:hypothetical protein
VAQVLCRSVTNCDARVRPRVLLFVSVITV